MKRSEGVETNVAESNSSSGGTTTEHSNKRIQFECKWCRKTFKYPSQLKEHVRVHTKEKPFPCKFCDRAFSHSSALTQHERIHTGARPFKCCHCEKSFSQSSNLKRHERVHEALQEAALKRARVANAAKNLQQRNQKKRKCQDAHENERKPTKTALNALKEPSTHGQGDQSEHHHFSSQSDFLSNLHATQLQLQAARMGNFWLHAARMQRPSGTTPLHSLHVPTTTSALTGQRNSGGEDVTNNYYAATDILPPRNFTIPTHTVEDIDDDDSNSPYTPRDTKTTTSAALVKMLHSPSMSGLHSLSSSDDSDVSANDITASDNSDVSAANDSRGHDSSTSTHAHGSNSHDSAYHGSSDAIVPSIYQSMSTPTPRTTHGYSSTRCYGNELHPGSYAQTSQMLLSPMPQPSLPLSPFMSDDVTAFLCLMSPAGAIFSPIPRFSTTPISFVQHAPIADDVSNHFRF